MHSLSPRFGAVAVVAVVVAAAAGCIDPTVPDGALISCTADADCPDGFVCQEARALCVAQANLDETPPVLRDTPTISPERGSVGTVFTLSFAVSEVLAAPPTVTVDIGGNQAAFVIDDAPVTGFGRARAAMVVVAGTAGAATFGLHLAWCAVGGLVVLLLVRRTDTRRVWPAIDWSVLVFFAGLFVVVEGFVNSGAPAHFFELVPLWQGDGLLAWLRLGTLFLLGSNLVSNVPFILVVKEQLAHVPDPRLAWQMLAVVSTFAGNLTLLGSVANIIVAEAGKDVGGLGFWQYLKVGAPLAVVTSVVGIVWIVAVG